ncbi:PREDICTED: uncharacterized protein LOC107328062 isoform X2 [Acropora digitifera]|uniref:uncharacterized protein LOC107328062 isoform X2 n=1 Tax=Acropora digitifera TaxID=70779 RepID=UPI00077A1DE0|nr:PREDICTED: uncharacterized protein LOC107328062 isoform X2 [Acropora digitifera]
MKSFALLSVLIILLLVDFASLSRTCRSLPFVQRYSNCSSTEYVHGFYRHQGKRDLLRDAYCCTLSPPHQNNAQNCTFIRLWDEDDYNDAWGKCPFGMFIQGIKRTKHQYSWIYDIEEVKCCHPKSETPSYEHCYEKNDRTLRHYEGWMFCAKDYFLVGLYRAECSGEPCSERFKCCTFIPRVWGQPLVGPVEGRLIRDSSITASSKQTPSAKISEVRIGGNDGWSPHASDKLPYLQFDLEKLCLICGFEVLGCKGSYVNLYRVHVSPEKDYLDSWNIIKPEFYGPDAEDKRAYRQLRVRKLGRYVRIFPRNLDPDAPISCIQVEIFGEPYIKINQDVFFAHNVGVTSYKKGRSTRFKGNDIVVEHYKGPKKLKSRISNGLLHYAKVVPSRIPWDEELHEDACVIATRLVKGREYFLSGRLSGKRDEYSVKFTTNGTLLEVARFKREQLQVVYGAWCGFTPLFLKPEKARDFWCPGEIIQIDAQITFYINSLFGLRRLSFDEVKDRGSVIRSVEYHETLEKDTPVLFLEEPEYLVPYKCVISGRFKGSYHGNKERLHFSHMNKSFPYTRKYDEVYHALNIDVDYCGKNEKNCWNSRNPFSEVTRLNCSSSKIWKPNGCRDENECRTGMANCGQHASCTNTPGFYNCSCRDGRTKHARKRPCSKRIEDNCKNLKCDKTTSCGYRGRCTCKSGFYQHMMSPHYKSYDTLDVYNFYRSRYSSPHPPLVCARRTHCSEECRKYKNAFCKIIHGSNKCLCKPGYQGFYQNCTDEDECISGRHQCNAHADCTNTMGSYLCKCKLGFMGDGIFCKELHECKNPSKSGECHPTLAKCVDFPGGYKCECKVGYHGDGIKNCTLADECELSIHECHKWATCINTRKSYECSCNKGYEGNGFTCKDVDECASNKNDCGFNKDGIECVNTNGSYMCACREGFTGDGKTCTNIDECKTGAHDCAKNATCTDREGSFSCKCTPGFYGNATEKCVDMDECSSSHENKCSKYATCINNHGSYECRCKKGFDGDGFNCQDIDECSNDEYPCPEQATCVNNEGEFECVCPEGYVGDGKDYCTVNSSPSTKTGNVWIFLLTMVTLSLFRNMI